ncbi:MAG: fibronectin type III domain-containing protein [Gammaproteobacteria bacterium]|nr:fibronectin type III domain-containing protein [Gammaproteobacteria bacterium]
MTTNILGVCALLTSVGIVHGQEALPPIVGSDLPGTLKTQSDIYIDGVQIDVTGFNRGGYIPDVDGDGIVEAYVKANEPGQPCETLVYVPSRQTTSADIVSSDLSGYTRIRNYGVLENENGDPVCPDGSHRLRVFGDITGDGLDELSTLYGYSGELIFDSAIPYGTVIDATNPIAGQVTVVADDLEVNPVGDFNGDGLVDWTIYSYSDLSDASESCFIMPSSEEGMRSDIDFEAISGDTPLGSFSRTEQDSCPRVTSIGDVNGDGFGDIFIFDGEYWVVHGHEQPSLGDSYRDIGYQVFDACNIWECQQSIDFDADGYDDLLVNVSSFSIDSLLASTGTLILYGGPDGLLSMDAVNPLPKNRSTQIIHKYFNPRIEFGQIYLPESVGDLNGDAATDLLITNYGLDRNSAGSILFGTPGRRPAVLVESSIDGGNGIYWSENNLFYAEAGPGDFDGDGYDELTYINTWIRGGDRIHRNTDPQSLVILNGPDSIDLRWQAPENISDLAGYQLVINGTINTELGEDAQSFRVVRGTTAINDLRLQAVDDAGDVIGEVRRSVDLQGTPIEDVQSRFRDVEFTAEGTTIAAENYTLTGVSYGPALGELFWNASKRFVLIWRNGAIVDRIEGNSYLVEEGGEYFITIDYFVDIPTLPIDQLISSGTLIRSNVVSVNQAVEQPPTNTDVPEPPQNLTASVYSGTTAELFWDRAPVDAGIVAYDIERGGVVLGRTEGTSYLDTSREATEPYHYRVFAIDQQGGRSDSSVLTTAAFDSGSSANTGVLSISGAVYSSTALEIFWSVDNIVGALPSRYTVFQNDQPVLTVDARSFFTSNLMADTTYSYVVVGLSASGEEVIRSDQLMLTTQ